MSTNQGGGPVVPGPEIKKIDYEEYARRSGEEAYRNAKQAGLSEEVALRFKEVFGTPIEPELRP